MTIEIIDAALCNGCGVCVDACPMDVIRMDDVHQKAVITYPDDCIMCDWCAQDCTTEAITIGFGKKLPFIRSWG